MNKIVNEARLAAIRAHGNQGYDIFPYEKHLQDVVDILAVAGYGAIYQAAGWLHDSMEDGRLSYNDIRKHFGFQIAEMVYAVTDELGRNRKERKAKTYPKIRANTDAVAIKLADRIANMEHGLATENKLSSMYQAEHKEFVEALFIHNEHVLLWGRLLAAFNQLMERSAKKL